MRQEFRTERYLYSLISSFTLVLGNEISVSILVIILVSQTAMQMASWSTRY